MSKLSDEQKRAAFLVCRHVLQTASANSSTFEAAARGVHMAHRALCTMGMPNSELTDVGNFGVDPEDSAHLLELREALDEHLTWPDEETEDAGDYVGLVSHTGQRLTSLLAEQRRIADIVGPLEPDDSGNVQTIVERVRELRSFREEVERLYREWLDSEGHGGGAKAMNMIGDMLLGVWPKRAEDAG